MSPNTTTIPMKPGTLITIITDDYRPCASYENAKQREADYHTEEYYEDITINKEQVRELTRLHSNICSRINTKAYRNITIRREQHK